ncbi:NAD(P)/FAD-dependent oxidoreductase [Nafulsella turpanensis]|uniref:NAD(P)/FAD-dependent oxidoreductase n=1 Tax=Nafulsella turpanensis TaxID=1265690 RepID=UPI0003470ECA|nr:NAD(P)/FAD-dependent oxidoreductase [Nafulsella turpanensis]
MKDVAIVGGGLAGLISAIQLADAGLEVVVIEQKEYPFHKVCGEYISNEVVPFLKSINCYPEHLNPVPISHFRLSDVKGQEVRMPLDLGGFGLSRYQLDNYLYQQGLGRGAEGMERTKVRAIEPSAEGFQLELSGGKRMEARLVLGAWGKRSTTDKALEREFIEKRSDYIGVKYHIKASLPHDEVALHNYPGGYCGVVKIEGDCWNMCYLGSKEQLRHYGGIEEMEQNTLAKNPLLKRILQEAEYIHDKPEVINEISFRPKPVVENGVLMAGDAAGLITPLCGNGMAMAIHGGKLLSDHIKLHWPLRKGSRDVLERSYAREWQRLFGNRLWVGRQTQKLFGNAAASGLAVKFLRNVKPAGRYLMQQTHGQPF